MTCELCDCADPTCDPNLATECDCVCHTTARPPVYEYGFSWLAGPHLHVTAWHSTLDAAQRGARLVHDTHAVTLILTRYAPR